MKRSLSLFAATLALGLLAASQSQATPYSYTFDWSTVTVSPNPPLAIGAGSGGVSFTNETPLSSRIGTDTVASNITTFSSAPDDPAVGPPDVVPTPSGDHNYTVTVNLSDSLGKTGTISFNGLLSGTLTGDSSNLSNSIVSSTDATGAHPGATFGTVTLGGNLFTVSYNGFANPGPHAVDANGNPVSSGAISFHIKFDPVIVGAPSPEPSSVVLGCLGLSFLGGVAYRRRRKLEALKAA